MTMAGWDDLHRELDHWTAADHDATLWWRDDDAQAVGPALDTLLDIGAETDTPLGLAVIPAGADDALAERLTGSSTIVLQHGYAHQNHAAPGEKKMELGLHRPAEHVVAEIAMGWQRLEALLGDRLVPVMVPPWNRIAPRLTTMLPSLRFAVLSTFGPRAKPQAWPGLTQVNTHIDIMDWDGDRGFAGLERCLGAAVDHLAARRTGTADPAEPTGLLTHHMAHDAPAWNFLGEFLRRTRAHGAARWLSPRDFLADSAAAETGAP